MLRLKKDLHFSNAEEAQDQIAALSQKIEERQRKEKEAVEELQQLQIRCSQIRGQVARIDNELCSLSEIDVQELADEEEKLVQDSEILKENRDAIQVRRAQNGMVKEKIEEMLAHQSEQEKELASVKLLSDTLNGTLSGKEKVMLETYVQMHYFDRVIFRANIRLRKMTNGQYELKRKEVAGSLQAQSGLDLDVLDYYNGTRRDVRSLSGGETFKASLCLALGLSDEIQQSAGGIQIDALFVDEGFGTLDEASLDQAIDALLSLAEGNRLVGIISHVQELKARIQKQIRVMKTRQGGSEASILI